MFFPIRHGSVLLCEVIQHPAMGAHSWDDPWASLDSMRAFLFLTQRLLLVPLRCGRGAKAEKVNEEWFIESDEDIWKKTNPTTDPGACCLPEFQRLTCQEVRELHSPQIPHWVPICIRSYFSAACKCRKVLSPHSNSVQLPGSLPSKERVQWMCLPLSDMLVTLWLCQNCTLQNFSDAAFKRKQLMGCSL